MSFLLLSGALLTLQPVYPIQAECYFPIYRTLMRSIKDDALLGKVGLLKPVPDNSCENAVQGVEVAALSDFNAFFDRYVTPPAHPLITPDLTARYCSSQDGIRRRLASWRYTTSLNAFGNIACSVSEEALQSQTYAERHDFLPSALWLKDAASAEPASVSEGSAGAPESASDITEEDKLLLGDDDTGSSIFSVMNATVQTTSAPPPKWQPLLSRKASSAHFLFPLTTPLFVTSPFGLRYHPTLRAFMRHEGTDFRAAINSDVMAVADGEVIETGYGPVTGFFITLRHANGWSSRYLHLSRHLVTKNQFVRKGNVIGLSGNTGRTNGPHLHLEISHNNQMVDPMKFVYEQSTSPVAGDKEPVLAPPTVMPRPEPVDMTPTIAVIVGEGQDLQIGVRIGHKVEMYRLQEPIETEQGVWRIVKKYGKFKLSKVGAQNAKSAGK